MILFSEGVAWTRCTKRDDDAIFTVTRPRRGIFSSRPVTLSPSTRAACACLNNASIYAYYTSYMFYSNLFIFFNVITNAIIYPTLIIFFFYGSTVCILIVSELREEGRKVWGEDSNLSKVESPYNQRVTNYFYHRSTGCIKTVGGAVRWP